MVRLPRNVTPAQAAYLLVRTRAASQTQETESIEQQHPGAIVSPITMGLFNGSACFVFSDTYPSSTGPQHEESYYMMIGGFTYQIGLDAPLSNWKREQVVLEEWPTHCARCEEGP